jgi:hypothetical protein
MTAEEHYREAERLLGEAAAAHAANPLGPASKYLVAAAQVHATLATAGGAGGPASAGEAGGAATAGEAGGVAAAAGGGARP